MWSSGREFHGPDHSDHTELPPQRNVKLRTACDRCHQSKMKCSGTVPCASCGTSGEPCIYSASNKSGRPKGVKNKRTSEQMSDNHRAVKAKSSSTRNMSPVEPSNHHRVRRQRHLSMASDPPTRMDKGLTNYDGMLLDSASASDNDFANDVISPFKPDFPWDLWDFNVEENLEEREITENVKTDLCIRPTLRYQDLANVYSYKINRASRLTTRLIYTIPSEQVVPKRSNSCSMIAQITTPHQLLPAWETVRTSLAGPLPQRSEYAQRRRPMTNYSPPRKRSSRHPLFCHPRPTPLQTFDNKHQGNSKTSHKTVPATAWNSIPPFFIALRNSNEAKTPHQPST
jgi:uncharacterized Zn finger protein (UPF0148 family)